MKNCRRLVARILNKYKGKPRAYYYYACSTYTRRSKDLCTKHSIRSDILEEMVLKALQVQISLIVNVSQTVNKLSKRANVNFKKKLIEDNLLKMNKELEKNVGLKKSAYEDWKLGYITEEEYNDYTKSYVARIGQIEENIRNAKEELKSYSDDNNANKWIEEFKKYKNVKKLSKNLVDDLIDEMYNALEGHPHRCDYPQKRNTTSDSMAQWDGMTPDKKADGRYCYCPITHKASLGTIVDYLESFKKMLNDTLVIPEIPAGSFVSKLYSMYLSYLPVGKMSYPLKMNVDERGVFTELLKTVNNGQVSINIVRPGNIRGQHWHNTKWEIFFVVSGHGLIQERKIRIDPKTGEDYIVREFEVYGEEMRAVVLLPGYAHNIINLDKDKDLVTVMWANESFDPNHPDTFSEEV